MSGTRYEDAPDTLRGAGSETLDIPVSLEDESNPGPVPISIRVARLEGKVDLLAKDVRAVLAQSVSSSKKLAIAKAAGTAVAGALVALAPSHAATVSKILDAVLSLFG